MRFNAFSVSAALVDLVVRSDGQQVDFVFTGFLIGDKFKEDPILIVY